MNHIAFDRAGHRDGDFTFAPSKAEREDRLPPVGAPSFWMLAALVASPLLTIGLVSLVVSLLSR
jgi:hypothetical protein